MLAAIINQLAASDEQLAINNKYPAIAIIQRRTRTAQRAPSNHKLITPDAQRAARNQAPTPRNSLRAAYGVHLNEQG